MESRESRPRRTWGVSEQKIVGARQNWRCGHCQGLLPPSYEVDHIRPLWEGGEDCITTNAEALCNNCHGKKTQLESIRRRDAYRDRREKAILDAKRTAAAETPVAPVVAVAGLGNGHRKEEEWRAKEAFIVDNPFLRYAFVPSIARRRVWDAGSKECAA